MQSLKISNQTGSCETRDAIAELEAGMGTKFKTTELLFDDLLDKTATNTHSAIPDFIGGISSSKLHKS